MGIRKLTSIAMLVAATAGTAGAQAVNFQGSVNGCFYTTASAPTTSAGCAAGSTTYGNLTYSGSTFNATSNAADGVLTLGRSPATPNFNNLGSFSLSDGTYNYTGQKFALFITFTVPGVPTGNGTYTSVLTGNLTGSTSGNVVIDFDNTQHLFQFGNGVSLSFAVNDLSINDETTSPATTAVTGQGVVTTPEPSSMALLGTGIIGLVPMIRRKK